MIASRRLPGVLPFLLWVGLVACQKGAGPESSHARLDETASSLRERFNQEVGRVRVVLLVAPT